MKPGVSYRAVSSSIGNSCVKSGHTPKGMLLHGRGIGEDRPQITGEVDGDMYTSATYTQHLDLPLRRRQCLRAQARRHAGRRARFDPLR